MTLKEFMEKKHQNKIFTSFGEETLGCPLYEPVLTEHYNSKLISFARCDGDCDKCWNQPYIETTDTTELTEKENENVKERTK